MLYQRLIGDDDPEGLLLEDRLLEADPAASDLILEPVTESAREDLVTTILAATAKSSVRQSRAMSPSRWSAWLGVAASLMVCAGLGLWTGRWASRADAVLAQSPATSFAVDGGIGLDAFLTLGTR
jgi:hypothetical protein